MREFILRDGKRNSMPCVIITNEQTKKGLEDGLIHVKEDGSLGNTIVSLADKSKDDRYGTSLDKMIEVGWVGFKYKN